MIATFDTIIFNPLSYSNVVVYLESPSIIVATGYFLGNSFSIQADYTSLSSYQYLLCDVSASIIISASTSITTVAINSTYSSNNNYTIEVYKTQFNQFYIINQPITYNSTAPINNTTGLNNITYSLTLYSSTTVYNIISNTIYSYSSITVYNSTTVYSITSNTIYKSITIYSATLASGNGSISPIILTFGGNITSWSTIYSLAYDQTMIITFFNSQTIFIPLQLTGNDNYRLILSQNITSFNNGSVTGHVLLYPNNSNAAIVYVDTWVINNNGSPMTGINAEGFPGFVLTGALGSSDATIINNSPFTKTVFFRDSEFGLNYDPKARTPAQIWVDYTTSWTMLGTIVLPQPASGYITILRLS